MIWTGTVLTVVVAGAAAAAVVAAPVTALGVVAGVWAAAAASEKIKKTINNNALDVMVYPTTWLLCRRGCLLRCRIVCRSCRASLLTCF